VHILARVGKPSPPGEGANGVLTGEGSSTDSDFAALTRRFHTRGIGTKMIAVIENIAVIVVVLVISGLSALGLGRLFLMFVLKDRRPS